MQIWPSWTISNFSDILLAVFPTIFPQSCTLYSFHQPWKNDHIYFVSPGGVRWKTDIIVWGQISNKIETEVIRHIPTFWALLGFMGTKSFIKPGVSVEYSLLNRIIKLDRSCLYIRMQSQNTLTCTPILGHRMFQITARHPLSGTTKRAQTTVMSLGLPWNEVMQYGYWNHCFQPYVDQCYDKRIPSCRGVLRRCCNTFKNLCKSYHWRGGSVERCCNSRNTIEAQEVLFGKRHGTTPGPCCARRMAYAIARNHSYIYSSSPCSRPNKKASWASFIPTVTCHRVSWNGCTYLQNTSSRNSY